MPTLLRREYDVADFGADTAPSLLASYVKLLHETATRLDTARSNEDTVALQALAHKVAGASGTVGAAALTQSARSIEGACKRKKFKWTPDIARFGDAVAAAIGAFSPLLDEAALTAFIDNPNAA